MLENKTEGKETKDIKEKQNAFYLLSNVFLLDYIF